MRPLTSLSIFQLNPQKQCSWAILLRKAPESHRFFVILQCLRRSRREFLQPSNRFGFSYELDNSNCSRLLRGRLYLLPRKGKIRWRSRMVGLDLRIPCVYNYKYGIVGKSHTKPTDRDCICRMDWYWSSRNSFSWHPLFPRTPNLLAFVFHLYADIVNYRT